MIPVYLVSVGEQEANIAWSQVSPHRLPIARTRIDNRIFTRHTHHYTEDITRAGADIFPASIRINAHHRPPAHREASTFRIRIRIRIRHLASRVAP